MHSIYSLWRVLNAVWVPLQPKVWALCCCTEIPALSQAPETWPPDPSVLSAGPSMCVEWLPAAGYSELPNRWYNHCENSIITHTIVHVFVYFCILFIYYPFMYMHRMKSTGITFPIDCETDASVAPLLGNIYRGLQKRTSIMYTLQCNVELSSCLYNCLITTHAYLPVVSLDYEVCAHVCYSSSWWSRLPTSCTTTVFMDSSYFTGYLSITGSRGMGGGTLLVMLLAVSSTIWSNQHFVNPSSTIVSHNLPLP